ncbi:MAG: hypothetical protein ACI8UO_004557 [Verrucomicrobiales bacterium]|jgi:hypothetical protein
MKTLLLLSVLALLPAESTQAQAPPSLKEIEPPDVYVHVDHVRQELELLRAWMGRPRDERPELGISGAEPREVFFQAITLFRKADRLAFEQTQRRARGAPRLPAGEIRPSHVYGRLLDATDAIREIVLNSGLESLDLERPDQVEIDAAAPSDVYDIASLLVSELAHLHAIVQANRQLNLLLERRFSPSDVFEQVTVAIGFCEQLLGRFPEAETMPKAPEFEPNKRPGDVYGRLLDATDAIREIVLNSGLESLDLERPDQVEIDAAAPSDVYDIASLLVSELAHLHAKLPDPTPPREAYFPGRKFPSDVYQRAGILEAQLSSLRQLSAKNPEWLER